jgi:hypothetical protein
MHDILARIHHNFVVLEFVFLHVWAWITTQQTTTNSMT